MDHTLLTDFYLEFPDKPGRAPGGIKGGYCYAPILCSAWGVVFFPFCVFSEALGEAGWSIGCDRYHTHTPAADWQSAAADKTMRHT